MLCLTGVYLTVCNVSELETSKAANASFCIALAVESNAKAEIPFVCESTTTFISKYYDVVGVYNVSVHFYWFSLK